MSQKLSTRFPRLMEPENFYSWLFFLWYEEGLWIPASQDNPRAIPESGRQSGQWAGRWLSDEAWS